MDSASIFGKAPDNQWYPIAVNAPVAATQTLTLVANVTANETVTVGGKTYTFRTSLTNVANYVLRGASAEASLDNLIAAINRGDGDGTLYAAATKQNTKVSAAAGSGDTMVVTARATGTDGNNIETTETMANGGNVWGDTTLNGGTNATLNGSSTIASVGDTTDAPVADNTTVASATAATGISLWKRLVNLGIAILAKLPTVGTAGTASANVVTVQGIASGTPLLATTTAAASASVTAATLVGTLKTVSATGTPEAIGSGLVESVAIRPKKTRTTDNTGNVWVQHVGTNDATGGWELTPTGSPVVFSAPAGKKIDLAAIFVDVATAGDGVIFHTVN